MSNAPAGRRELAPPLLNPHACRVSPTNEEKTKGTTAMLSSVSLNSKASQDSAIEPYDTTQAPDPGLDSGCMPLVETSVAPELDGFDSALMGQDIGEPGDLGKPGPQPQGSQPEPNFEPATLTGILIGIGISLVAGVISEVIGNEINRALHPEDRQPAPKPEMPPKPAPNPQGGIIITPLPPKA